MVHARAVIGDQLQPLAGAFDQARIDVVGHGRHEHIGVGHGRRELRLVHRRVAAIVRRIEQLLHAPHHHIRKLAGDDNLRVRNASHFGHESGLAKRFALVNGS